MTSKALLKFVERACRHYADAHGLRLKRVRVLTRAESLNSDGQCWDDGVIGFALDRLEPYRVLDVMAHELAHLAHFNHDEKWMRLHTELVQEMLANGELNKIKQVCPILPS